MTDFGFSELVDGWLATTTLEPGSLDYAKTALLFAGLLVICTLAYFLMRFVLLRFVEKLVSRTKTVFDDILMEKEVFNRVAQIVPALLIELYVPEVFGGFPAWEPLLIRITEAYIIYVSMHVLLAVFNSFRHYAMDRPALKDKPIDSFVQLGKILVWSFFLVWMVSVLVGKSPFVFFGAMGAVSAVLLLIFKDTILGFVASIQLAANDMVRVGDWVSLPQFGADGDVIEITLATIKIRNFDKTFTTVPTYRFISDAFKNWRGMEEADGRRLKRTIAIKTSSIKFCTNEMVEKFKKYHLIEAYVLERQKEIDLFNENNKVDKKALINGRHMTNIGIFRRYIEFYLRKHPEINQNMTCMVRQLQPAETGLPLEIYAFVKKKEWIIWEGIVADIFDHVLSAVPEFELEIFESPTGILGPIK